MKDNTSQPPSGKAPPGAWSELKDLTGQTLGEFRILRRLGQGGMGQVYLAEQIALKRKVALKILRQELAADSVSLQRFKAEAENVARASHGNIVQVYAIGEANGLHYMALEYVEGRNLREYLEKKGPPALAIALSIMRQVAAALQRAGELGIIHRDVKPENILLTRRGEAKVADFGLSRCFAPDARPLKLTQSGVSMGTPLYMSPEQVAAKQVDHRTDIYSLGVTSYHLLAGNPPFQGQSPLEVAIQHVQNEPVPLARIRPDLPAEVCALVHKMMAKNPSERYQTCGEIVKELGRLRDALVGQSGTNLAISMGPAPPQPSDQAATQVTPPPRWRRRRLPWLLAGSIVLALAGGLVAGRLWYRPADKAKDELTIEIKAPQSEREKELIKLIQEHPKPGDKVEFWEGLKNRRELGILYLKERRLDEADRFFKELDAAEQQFHPYRLLGKLGQGMVLAFKDQARDSMAIFQKVLGMDKGKAWFNNKHWINTPAFREVLAEALNYNFLNSPETFPGWLGHLRHPPRAELKKPPADSK